MGHQTTIVDTASPEAIAQAIRTVNQTPSLRIKPGTDALWALFKAPDYLLPRLQLEKQFGALDLHFGWFCRRVAERLGVNAPDALALVDYSVDADGRQMLTLKPSVVAAMKVGRRGLDGKDATTAATRLKRAAN